VADRHLAELMPLCNFSEKRAPVSVTRWLYVAGATLAKERKRVSEREREREGGGGQGDGGGREERTGTRALPDPSARERAAATVRRSVLRIDAMESAMEPTVANALRNDAGYRELGSSRAINVMQGSSNDAMRCDAVVSAQRATLGPAPEALARIPVARCGHGKFPLSQLRERSSATVVDRRARRKGRRRERRAGEESRVVLALGEICIGE